MMMKVLQERDNLIDAQLKIKTKQVSQNDFYQPTVKKESMFEALISNQIKQKTIETRAEINVLKKEIDCKMIKASIQMISNEHNSLLATFE